MPRTPALFLALIALVALTPGAHARQDDHALSEQDARALLDTLEHADTIVVDFGEGPRRALRFTPLQGYTLEYDAAQYLAVERTFDGIPMEGSTLPTHTARVRTVVSAVNDRRDFTLISTLTDLDIDEASDANDRAKATVRAMLQPLEGVAAVRTCNDRGLPIRRDDVRTDPTDDRELAQRIAQIPLLPILILPDEPVADGAVWRARRDFNDDNTDQTIILTYTLLGADDHRIRVRVHGRYLLDEQTLPPAPRCPKWSPPSSRAPAP
ncbi:MAG: hypothetical protein Tsb0013_18240 [Phycisphaerales bacterium]